MERKTITVGETERPVGTKWIEHHKTYFLPRANDRPPLEVLLMIRNCKQMKRSVQRKPGVMTFIGNTLEEAETKMAKWIEQSGASEIDFDEGRV